MVHGHCMTNLDAYKREAFPTAFVGIPRIGDKVESDHGSRLSVVAILHVQNQKGEPSIVIELHK